MNNATTLAQLEATELAFEIERLSLNANDKARDRFAFVMHGTMLWGDDTLCIDALASGLDIVLSVKTGTFIASFARRGYAETFARSMPHDASVVLADNCAEIIHFIDGKKSIVEGI